jgi:hypothetical protein
MAVVQELSNRDMANHSMVVEHLTGILSDDVIILMTNEAHFQLSGCVNEHNFHCWGEENPQLLHKWPLYSACVTVWCGVANFRDIGPYFFEDKDGHAVTVGSSRYIECYGTSTDQN